MFPIFSYSYNSTKKLKFGTSPKAACHNVNFKYFWSHIIHVPFTSFTTLKPSSSIGYINGTSGSIISRMSTLNHIGGMSLKWNLCTPGNPLILPTATLNWGAVGLVTNTFSPCLYWMNARKTGRFGRHN